MEGALIIRKCPLFWIRQEETKPGLQKTFLVVKNVFLRNQVERASPASGAFSFVSGLAGSFNLCLKPSQILSNHDLATVFERVHVHSVMSDDYKVGQVSR